MVEYVKRIPWKPEQLKKYRYPALILALGLLLLLIPGGRGKTVTAEPEPREQEEAGFDLSAFTEEAESLLSQLQGAGEVRLLLTLEDDGAREYLMDSAISRGDSLDQTDRKAVLLTRDGEEFPVTVYRTYPRFRGALVVCKESNPTLTLKIKEAVSGLTGLGMDRITVLSSR